MTEDTKTPDAEALRQDTAAAAPEDFWSIMQYAGMITATLQPRYTAVPFEA